MKSRTLRAVIVFHWTLLMLSNCSAPVDRTADFAMIHNGNPYRVRLAPPIGKVIETEVGYTSTFWFYILFPTAAVNPNQARGFQLQIDPDDLITGGVISDSSLPETSKFRIRYHPNTGHRLNEGILLAYSTGMTGGSFKIRFDIFEPAAGGRVKGEILEAALVGFYERQDDMAIIPPKKPKILEIFHFKFDTRFQIHPF